MIDIETRDKILALRHEAIDAGDHEQIHLCELALCLAEPEDEDDYSVAEAVHLCLDAIDAAAALATETEDVQW